MVVQGKVLRQCAILAVMLLSPLQASADEQDDALLKSREAMRALGEKAYERLWDELTSDWAKQNMGGQRDQYIANMRIQRYPIGKLTGSNIIGTNCMDSALHIGWGGKLCVTTFYNNYSTGNSNERIFVILENGGWKLSGFDGAPAQ